MSAPDSFNGRGNLVSHASERWRPPPHSGATTFAARFARLARRVFDLQFGSIWRDLSGVFPEIEGTVVDVGCGAQPFRGLFRGPVRYIGVDTADAGERFGYRNPDTRYYSGDTLPIESDSCDFALCTETLEHVLEPVPFLKELRRCMKPGARVLITVPFAARWHYVPFDYWRFTPSGLAHLLGQARFVDVRVYARGNQLTVACYKVMACILPLALSQRKNPAWRFGERLLGLLLSPLLLGCALIAYISLLSGGSAEDCLGFTVFATKPDATPRQ